jgi:5'-nucleotidase (lipoprotein e(P4) family)
MKSSFVKVWLPYLLLFILLPVGFTAKYASEQKQAERPKFEYLQMAVLWQQTSGEVRALYHQAFRCARAVLDRELKSPKMKGKRSAIITDIDETILDNSPFDAQQLIKNGKASWSEWTALAKAEAVAGAKDFLTYAKSKGVDVFYVTNRSFGEREATMKNLARVGFPFADTVHTIMKTGGWSKESRRQEIEKKYNVLLLMGDNLNDFLDVFHGRSPAQRAQAVDSLSAAFGDRFIVMPNAVYGDWESAIYGYNEKLSDQERATKRQTSLQGF